MRIGIVGSGRIGSTLARLLARTGHEVVIANSRGPASLTELVAEIGGGTRAGTVAEAAEHGELVVVAIPLKAIGSLPSAPFAGRIVVDANNYYPGRDGQVEALDRDETTSTELLAAQLPDARVVKAFNTMYFETLGEAGDPDAPEEERLVIFLAGDDDEAKATVAGLIRELGFAPLDTGSLAEGGRRQQPGAPVYGVDLRPEQAAATLRRP